MRIAAVTMQQVFRRLRLLAVASALSGSVLGSTLAATSEAADGTPATPEVWRYCAHAERLNGDLPFFQTRLVELRVTGLATPDERRDSLAATWARTRIWTENGVSVKLERIEAASNCPASSGHQVSIDVEVTPELLDQLRKEEVRGDFTVIPAELRNLANQAVSGVHERLGIPSTTNQIHWFSVHYATNRQRLNDLAETGFTNGVQMGTSVGKILVGVAHRPQMDKVMSAAVERIEQVTHLTAIQLSRSSIPMSIAQWKEDIARHAQRDRDRGVLVFFHGFNNSFADAARRAAQLTYDLGWPGATVIFSWPSHNSIWNYSEDGRLAASSRDAASNMLRVLTGLGDTGPLFIVAHSMGNRVMLSALKELLSNDADAAFRIKHIVMAAPDVPLSWFERDYELMLSRSRIGMTLYANRFDKSMPAATIAEGERPWRQRVAGATRLGAGGDSMIVRSYLDSVDASAVAQEMFALNHSYFGDQSNVLSDLFRTIRIGEPAARRSGKTIDPRGSTAARNGWTVRVR